MQKDTAPPHLMSNAPASLSLIASFPSKTGYSPALILSAVNYDQGGENDIVQMNPHQ